VERPTNDIAAIAETNITFFSITFGSWRLLIYHQLAAQHFFRALRRRDRALGLTIPGVMQWTKRMAMAKTIGTPHPFH
jgi:hypothetical protein